jgi:hypothetical protein
MRLKKSGLPRAGLLSKKNLIALDWVEQKSCVCTSHPNSYTYKRLRLDIKYFASPVNNHGRNREACPLTPPSDQMTKAGEGEFVRCRKGMKVQGLKPLPSSDGSFRAN